MVDSCIEQSTRKNPALEYLSGLGVDVETSVQLIVATHAHDDHFAGIADAFSKCKESTFVASQAATSEEFLALIELDSTISSMLRMSAYSEFRKVYKLVESRGRLVPDRICFKRAVANLPLYERQFSEHNFRSSVRALSPSHHSVTRASRPLAETIAQQEATRKRLQTVDPNEFAVALWVDVGGRVIILGADLTSGPAGCGWRAVLADHAPGSKAELFKVPHHGAPNAHHPGVWDNMLMANPLALIAPFRAGRNPRPSEDDINRILSLTNQAYITASPQIPAQGTVTRKRGSALGPLATNPREPWGKVGQVRARGTVGKDDWQVDLFHPARALS